MPAPQEGEPSSSTWPVTLQTALLYQGIILSTVANTMPGLVDMASEVVAMIADELCDKDLCRFRLVCRDLSARCEPLFESEYFARVITSSVSKA